MNNELMLGQSQPYEERYNPDLLRSVARADARARLPDVRFYGEDLWTAFELSWLAPTGKPHIAIAEFLVPQDSPNIIESKSLKYYLNAYNQTVVQNIDELRECLTRDLSTAAGAAIKVVLYSLKAYADKRQRAEVVGECIDGLELKPSASTPRVETLQLGLRRVRKTLYSRLLRSRCPVTGQPDWASVWVGYEGTEVIPQSLLAYLVSFRQHQGFHEHCVEKIYTDIWQAAQPSKLWVYARYTRRGAWILIRFAARNPCHHPM